jgi:ABC-type nitrate/sulfonate/bicarbonate transport system substrate-binding protein
MVKKHRNLQYIPFTLLIIFVMLLPACGGKSDIPTDELTPIRYGGQFYPEEFVLKGEDFFSKYGLSVEHAFFGFGDDNNRALISGAIDINIGSDSRSVALFDAMGNDVIIIATSQRGNRYSTMVNSDSEITSWYDMVGQKVGIRLGTGAEMVVRSYFEEVGDLRWEDFEWVDLKVEDMPTALADGLIASFTAWEPIISIAETKNGAVVMMSYGQTSLSPVFIHTTTSYATDHRKELVAFLRGHLDKQTMIQADVEEAARIAAKAAADEGIEISAKVFKSIFQRGDFSLDVDDNVVNSLKETARYLLKIGEIEKIPEFYVDTSYLEEAKKLNQ